MKYLREKLSSKNIKDRILWSMLLFFIVFFMVTIISYFVLPQGLLKNKNSLQSWNTSDNVLILTLQIFFYNLISVTIIFLASLFSQKNKKEQNYLSLGYTVFITLISINAVVLGTWSFSIEFIVASLFERIIYIFDIIHKAALWEMLGQLLITCSIANISIINIYKTNTTRRNIKKIKPTKEELITLIVGFILMLIGAIIESVAIINL